MATAAPFRVTFETSSGTRLSVSDETGRRIEDASGATYTYVDATNRRYVLESADGFREVIDNVTELFSGLGRDVIAAFASVEEYRRVVAEHGERLADAWEKAERLLLMFLDDNQRKTWSKGHYFDVRSQSGRRFRIFLNRSGNVCEIPENFLGIRVDTRYHPTYCIGTTVDVPLPDQLLAQKLMLEYREEEFFRIANRV